MDVVNLGMKVDSRPLAKATAEVHQFSRAGKTVAKDVARFGAGAKAGFTQASVAATAATSAFRMAAGAIGGLLAFAGVGRAMSAFVGATVEADKAQAQLAATLRSTGGMAGQTVETLGAHAAALQRMADAARDGERGRPRCDRRGDGER